MDSSEKVNHGWMTTPLTSETQILETLDHLRVCHWVSRGHSKFHRTLFPKIDRKPLDKIVDRANKIALERQSIELFRSTARFFASPDEQNALMTDLPTLMVLQHYGVPTRLLDWSESPYVATYFSVCNDEGCDGEIWSFDERQYEIKGREQWKNYPEIPLDSPIEFRYAMALDQKEPKPDFFMCVFYYQYFHRISAQEGAFSMTAQFGKDHAESISNLLEDSNLYHRYIIKADLKPKLRQVLQVDYGIWSGSLFPDTAGAAETVKEIFKVK
jgi:hypothetical protein